MAIPWGPIISAVGTVVGGALASRSARDQAEENTALQREFAQHGIRWKVEDAKAAGLHPLFALGGGGATFTPNPIVTPMGDALNSMGQSLGQAVSRQQQSSQEEEARLLQKKLVQSQIDENDARAHLLRSQAHAEAFRNFDFPGGQNMATQVFGLGGAPRVIMQELAPFVGSPSTGGSRAAGEAPRALHHWEVPPEVAKTPQHDPEDRSVTAPMNRMWQRYVIRDDRSQGLVEMVLPSKEASEPLESMSEGMLIATGVIAENIRRYGPEWAAKVLNQMPGSKLANAIERYMDERKDSGFDRFMREFDRRLGNVRWFHRQMWR